MSIQKRYIFYILLDSFIVINTIFLSNFILLPRNPIITLPLLISAVTLIITHHILSYIFKLYKSSLEYASIREMIIILKTVTFSILVLSFVQFFFLQDIYLRTLTITWMSHILLIGGSRFLRRCYMDRYKNIHKLKMKRTLVVGAGSAGTMVVRQLIQSHDALLCPVAFIDDDVRKHDLDILGLPVLGGIKQIKDAVESLYIENIIISIPSLSKKELNNIFHECKKTKAQTQIIPKLEDLMLGKVSVNEIRNVEVEDLLGRDPVELDTHSIKNYLSNKIVLVTGAGGSIGSEICRQISMFKPSKLILLGHGENSIYSIEMELQSTFKNNIEFITEIADIQDRDKIFQVMRNFTPDVVFHAAAHKHVPLMERNPEEAFKNNVIGTKNVAEAADAADVKTFVMISTDKAVNPTSVMGSTKKIAELVIQNLDKSSQTRFVAVRFGNVLGSRGSVIPLFKEQIKNGGPVTITHPEMQRYFMTIPEASRLVLQAGAFAKGGEVFVLDMGNPVKIVDLAKNLIRLSGFTEEEIPIEFTEMRPGEKLMEELLNKDEVIDIQIHPKIHVGKSIESNLDEVWRLIIEFPKMDSSLLRNKLLNIANGSNQTIKV
ncbi:polysaccharide biosynthesis protein [Paenisporosarcina quisquiliarum]|uniref:polysaccharide biosynthesis protein n=1 Tax=Paenisporosarcina quisquiliarum TaxID=365346 RepID=UPI0037356635